MISAVIDAGDGLPLTLGAWVRRQAEAYGDRLLLVSDDERLTYAEAESKSRLLARALLAAGVTKGSHVALLHSNSPDFVVGVMAVTRIGAVALPMSTLSAAEELRGQLANSDTGFLLSATSYRSRNFVQLLQAAIPELDYSRPAPLTSLTAPWLRRIWFSGPAPEGMDPSWTMASLEAMAPMVDEARLEAVERRVSPADRFVIIHTSGSTSAPKAVIHGHGALLRTLANVQEMRCAGPDDILFSTAPWFWVAGFAWSLLNTILSGGRIVVTHATAPPDIVKFLARERPNMTLGYGRTVAPVAADPSFISGDFSFIRRGTLHPLLAPDVRPKDSSLRHEVWGMTEVGGCFSMWPDESDLPEHMRGACGKPLPGFESKLVDPETGKECAVGEVGELWMRSPFMMEGYYGKHRSQVFEPDGWWRSGDVGVFDAEGFFYWKGRMGDMIKTNAANVSPREVEAVLAEETGGGHVIVLGLPDPERGQVVAGVVITDAAVDEAGLKKRLAERLSSYKVPRRIIGLSQPDIPLLSSGKVDMRRLTEVVRERW